MPVGPIVRLFCALVAKITVFGADMAKPFELIALPKPFNQCAAPV